MTAVAQRVEPAGAVRAGLTDMSPAVLGVVPFAIMIGVAIAESHVASGVGFAGGLMVAGGSAHLAVVGSLQAASGFLATVLTALMVQMRGLAYSASLAPTLRRHPRWFQWLASYLMVDQVYALSTAVVDRPDRWFRQYYLAAGGFIFGAYSVGIVVGLIAGPVIPAGSPVTMAVPLMFAALLAPSLTSLPSLAAAGAAAVAAVVLPEVAPSGIAPLLAMGAGAMAGTLVSGGRA